MAQDNKRPPKRNRTWYGFKKKPAILAKADLPTMDHDELVDEQNRVRRTDRGVLALGVAVTATAAGIWGSKLLEGSDPLPPSVTPEQLNPPTASVPADPDTGRPDVDMVQVQRVVDGVQQKDPKNPDSSKGNAQGESTQDIVPAKGAINISVPPVQLEQPKETDAERKARENQYVESLNQRLIVPESKEKILADEEKVRVLFENKILSENIDYLKIPNAVELVQAAYGNVEAKFFINAVTGKSMDGMSLQEMQAYFKGLPASQQYEIRTRIINATDFEKMQIGMASKKPIREELNLWLQRGGELTPSGGQASTAGYGR